MNSIYRGANKGLFVLLSRTQAGPSITVKQEQEEISRNYVQTFISPSVPSAFVSEMNDGTVLLLPGEMTPFCPHPDAYTLFARRDVNEITNK